MTLLVLPLVVSWFAALLCALLDGRRRTVGWLAVALAALLTASLFALLIQVLEQGAQSLIIGGWPEGIGIRLRADALGTLYAAVSLVVLTLALAFEVMSGVVSRTFPALALFLGVGLTGLFLTGDVFNFYVFFEIAMMAAFALASYGEQRAEIRAAAIFTIVNLLGSAFLLIAVAALYRITGTLDMVGIGLVELESRPSLLIATLIFIAFGLKLGLYPFHYWVPAVYQDTRPAVTAILAGALANIGSYGLLRFGGELLPGALAAAQIPLLLLGSLSILYGSLLAVSRRLPREVLAYSSIGQVGYILLALAVGGPVGYAAAVLYALLNALNKALLFLAAELRGPLVAAAFFVGALSTAGVPPAAGFFGKIELFRVGLDAGSAGLLLVVFAGSALSFVYMFQVYQYIFWQPKAPRPTSAGSLRWLALGLAGLVLLLGLVPEPLLEASRAAGKILENAPP